MTIKRRSAVIECRVQSIFEPQIIWTKENTIIRESGSKKTRIERVRDVSVFIAQFFFFMFIYFFFKFKIFRKSITEICVEND